MAVKAYVRDAHSEQAEMWARKVGQHKDLEDIITENELEAKDPIVIFNPNHVSFVYRMLFMYQVLVLYIVMLQDDTIHLLEPALVAPACAPPAPGGGA